MFSKKRSGTPIIIISAAVVALITIVAFSIVIGCSKKSVKNEYVVEKGDVILTVDDMDFTENQMRFFATLQFDSESNVYSLLYIDSEDERNEAVKGFIYNFVKEYVYCLKEAEALGLNLTDEEKEEISKNIKADYDEYKKVGSKVYEGDAFYDYYYGLTEAQFREFNENWAVVEKYYAWCESNADLSEEAQRKTFDEYYTGLNATVISLSLDGLSEEDRNTKVTLANELLEKILRGSDMAALVEKHCDDETIKENKGAIQITPLFENAFPEIYAWSKEAKAGDLAVIESEYEVYVLRCDSVIEFDEMVNTEEMIATTKSAYVDSAIHSLIDSSKYTVTKHDKYDSQDYKTMIQSAISQWAEIWSNEA